MDRGYGNGSEPVRGGEDRDRRTDDHGKDQRAGKTDRRKRWRGPVRSPALLLGVSPSVLVAPAPVALGGSTTPPIGAHRYTVACKPMMMINRIGGSAKKAREPTAEM